MPFTDPFVANPFPFAVANTLPLANTLYDVTASLVSGVYTISWSGCGTLNIDFYNGTTFVTSATGTSSITVNLAQSVTNYKMWCTVAPISVVVSLSGLSVAPISGTLYTYTTSGTPGLVGDAYVVIVGGGGAGGINSGGGSGGLTGFRVPLTGTETLTIGIKGVYGVSAGKGGDTSFAGNIAGGGLGGVSGGTGGAGGTPNGVAGGNNAVAGQTTVTISTFFSFFTQGSTGSGSGTATPGSGGGSGVGKGGDGVTPNATGFGAGGGNGAGNGSPGICYIVI